MKTAVIYYSKHHENTKKILDAIAKENQIDLIDIAMADKADLSQYDCIGFASGIYFSKFQKKLIEFAEKNMLENKKTFFIYTYGSKNKSYTKAITKAVEKHNAEILGEYGCYGYDSYGPFKLVGGIAKGHPNQDEINEGVSFYKGLNL